MLNGFSRLYIYTLCSYHRFEIDEQRKNLRGEQVVAVMQTQYPWFENYKKYILIYNRLLNTSTTDFKGIISDKIQFSTKHQIYLFALSNVK